MSESCYATCEWVSSTKHLCPGCEHFWLDFAVYQFFWIQINGLKSETIHYSITWWTFLMGWRKLSIKLHCFFTLLISKCWNNKWRENIFFNLRKLHRLKNDLWRYQYLNLELASTKRAIQPTWQRRDAFLNRVATPTTVAVRAEHAFFKLPPTCQ